MKDFNVIQESMKVLEENTDAAVSQRELGMFSCNDHLVVK